jgi:hypothetical protein
MVSTFPSKDTDWHVGLKRKTWQFVVYKKPTSQTETNTGLGRKGGKRFTKQIGPQKEAGVAILLSDNADFKPKLVRRDKCHFLEEITIVNLYAPNFDAPNFIQQNN